MKRLWILWGILFFMVPGASAETLYVNDFVRVTLRTGPGLDYRVIDMVGTGTKVTPLEQRDEWTRVQVLDGKEGWILSRHLTPDPPSVLLVERLKEENQRQKTKLTEFSATNVRLEGEVKRLEKELDAHRRELAALKETHEALKTGASDYLELKSKYETVSAGLEEATRRAERYEKDLTRLQLHQNIRWFLSGAGVLVLGFIIGFSSKRQRKRSSLL